MSHTLAFAAGLFLAWCTFEGFRRAWGRLFVILFLVADVSATGWDRTAVHNTGSGTLYVTGTQQYNDSGYSSLYGTQAGFSVAAGATGYYGTAGANNAHTSGKYVVLWISCSPGTLTGQSFRLGQYVGAASDLAFNHACSDTDPNWTTNYVMCLTAYCNTNFSPMNLVLRISTNGVVAAAYPAVLYPGDCTPVLCITNSVPLSASLSNVGSEGAETVLRSWSSSGTSVYGGTGGGFTPPTITPTPGEPDLPTPTTNNIPTDTRAADRENTEMIIRAIGDASLQQRQTAVDVGDKEINALVAELEQVRTNGTGTTVSVTNSVSVSLTNVVSVTNNFDLTWTNILLGIRTNTDYGATNTMVMTNQLRGDTNSLSSWVTNVSGALAAASNEFASTSFAGSLREGRSAVEGTLTNQAVSSDNTALQASITQNGHTYMLNMDPFAAGSGGGIHPGLRATLLSWANWLRAWMLKLVPFVMWWAFANRLFFFSYETAEKASTAVKNPDAAPWSLAGRVVGFVLIAILAGLVAYVPSALVAKMQLITMSADIPSIADHLGTSSGTWGASATRLFACLSELIPFTTLVFCLAHYAAFELYGRELLAGFIWALRAFKWIVWILPVCLTVNGATVRFSVLTTNSVVLTNSARSLALPIGSTEMNLEDTGWGLVGYGSLTIVDSSAPENEAVIRIGNDLLGVLIVDQAWDEGEWSWFWGGYQVGFVVFGLAFAVSAIRAGTSAAIRNSVSD